MIDFKIILSMIAGAALILALQASQPNNASFNLMNSAYASTQVSSINEGDLSHCEIFFSDDRNFFETEINKRILKSKLIQSNVIWSETDKQLGFYAMICY